MQKERERMKIGGWDVCFSVVGSQHLYKSSFFPSVCLSHTHTYVCVCSLTLFLSVEVTALLCQGH